MQFIFIYQSKPENEIEIFREKSINGYVLMMM